MDLIIQFLGGGTLFINKILLRKKLSISWLVGIAGIMIASIPSYQKELWIILGYNAGLIVLLMYGYILTKNSKGIVSNFWKLFFRILIISGTFTFCIYLFVETQKSKDFSLLQLGQSIGGLLGALFLGFNKKNSNIIGWTSNILSHFASAYLMHAKGLQVIAFFQILSVIVAIKAIKDEVKQELPDII